MQDKNCHEGDEQGLAGAKGWAGGILLQEASSPPPVSSPEASPELVIQLSSHFVDDA